MYNSSKSLDKKKTIKIKKDFFNKVRGGQSEKWIQFRRHVYGFFMGIAASLLFGMFIATDDDIEKHQIDVAIEVCGGIEKVSKFDTDGTDTFVCIEGGEYAFGSNFIFTSAPEVLKKRSKKIR